jgi:hypothetical protein
MLCLNLTAEEKLIIIKRLLLSNLPDRVIMLCLLKLLRTELLPA